MQTAIIYRMEEKDNPHNREALYKVDDVKIMRTQLDKLAGLVGDLNTAIIGNDYGTVGILGQVKEMNMRLDAFEIRIDNIETSNKNEKIEATQRNFYVRIIWALVASGATGIFMTILHNIFIKK